MLESYQKMSGDVSDAESVQIEYEEENQGNREYYPIFKPKRAAYEITEEDGSKIEVKKVNIFDLKLTDDCRKSCRSDILCKELRPSN